MAIGSILGTAAIGVAAGGASTAINAAAQSSLDKATRKFNREEAEKAREFNAEEAQKNRDFQSEQAEINREYYSEEAVMQRRKDAGLNSAVIGDGVSTSASGTPSGSAATASPATFSGSAVHPGSNPLVEAVDILDKVADIRGKGIDNDVKSNTGMDRALAEIEGIVRDNVRKELDNDFTAQTFKDRLTLMSNSVTSAQLDNELKDLQKYDINNKIQNDIEEAYFLYVQNNAQMFNTLLNAENFEHQWQQDSVELKLKIEEFKREWNDMSFRHGKRITTRTPDLDSEEISRSSLNRKSASVGGGSAGGVSIPFGGSEMDEASKTSSFTYQRGSETTEQGQSFVNGQLGKFCVSISALWDIANDSSKDVRERKLALRELRDTLGDMERYGRFQVMIRELRGKAFGGTDSLQVE